MASIHTTVTIQAFNGLEYGWKAHDFLCAHTQEGEGLLERHTRLFEVKTYLPGEETVHQLRTNMPVEDEYAS